MFGISFSEILLILIIALIVLGPKQLSSVINTVCRLIITIRKTLISLKHDMYNQSGLNEFNNTKNLLVNNLQQLKQNVYSEQALTTQFDQSYMIHDQQQELEFDKEPDLF